MPYGDINTGDVILFSSNIPSNFIVKFFSSSEWSHIGIAVRIDDDGVINANTDSKLYVLEINTKTCYDPILKEEDGGLYFNKACNIFPFYPKIYVRKLKEKYRTQKFIESVIMFAHKYKKNKFPENPISIVSAWLGISFGKIKCNEMICSEFVSNFYIDCLGNTLNKKLTMKDLLGENSPRTADICKPEHFSAALTKNSTYFEPKNEVLIANEDDMVYVIIVPLILTIAIVVFICMTIREN